MAHINLMLLPFKRILMFSGCTNIKYAKHKIDVCHQKKSSLDPQILNGIIISPCIDDFNGCTKFQRHDLKYYHPNVRSYSVAAALHVPSTCNTACTVLLQHCRSCLTATLYVLSNCSIACPVLLKHFMSCFTAALHVLFYCSTACPVLP